MRQKITTWIVDKWLAGFLTGSIFFFGKVYMDLPEEKKANFFHFIWLKEILALRYPLWAFILVLLFVITMFMLKIRNKQSFKNGNNKLMSYRRDLFGSPKVFWGWDYDLNGLSKKLTVKDVKPLCPTCHSPMEIKVSNVSMAICPRCRLDAKNHQFEVKQFQSDVSTEIVRRMKTGAWMATYSQFTLTKDK